LGKNQVDRDAGDDFEPPTRAINGPPAAGASDTEDTEELLRATTHIWEAPLNNYVLERHAERQRLGTDFEKNELSRQFLTVARVVDMSSTRILEMVQRKTTREFESRIESENNAAREEQDQQRFQNEDHTRIAKEREREIRLEKQRGEAAKRREEEKAKKERDEERKRIKAEAIRLLKAAELERRAALSPEDRATEDRIIAEKLQSEREALAAHNALVVLKNAEESENTEGRGARKRRKRTVAYGDEDELELEPAASPDGRFGSAQQGDMDEFDDTPLHSVPFDYDAMSSGLSSARSETDEDENFDMDIASESDPKDLTFDVTGNATAGGSNLDKPAKSKRPKLNSIADLEKRVWTQIARKEIPKVGIFSSRVLWKGIARLYLLELSHRWVELLDKVHLVDCPWRNGFLRLSLAKLVELPGAQKLRKMFNCELSESCEK
jgi:hypothetical protein